GEIIETLTVKLLQFKRAVQRATKYVLTFGTVWAYRHVATKQLVAQGKKIPQKQFSKELLSVVECQEAMDAIEKGIRRLNPTIQIIYTISPVRHIKDGFVENQRSKAHLIAALHGHLENNQINNYYFPSYEL